MKRMDSAINKAIKKALATAKRDMKAEANKRVRETKRLKVRKISEAIETETIVRGLAIALNVRGDRVTVSDYPNRFTRKGLSVAINKNGARSFIPSAFRAQIGITDLAFRRKGKARLPIERPLASRPVDALLHPGQAQQVAERGARSFTDTLERLLGSAIASGIPSLKRGLVR